jgi:hypothetical protein
MDLDEFRKLLMASVHADEERVQDQLRLA